MTRLQTPLACAIAGSLLSGCVSFPSKPPIHRAIIDDDRATAARLIDEARGKRVIDQEADSLLGGTPIFFAAYSGQDDLVKRLIAKGADVNYVNRKKYGGGFDFTPLLAAASAGRDSTIELLLAAGADVRAKTTFGWNALMVAALYDHEDTVRLLQGKGLSLTPAQYNEILTMKRCDYANGRADGYAALAVANHFTGKYWNTAAQFRSRFCTGFLFEGTRCTMGEWQPEFETVQLGQVFKNCPHGNRSEAYKRGWDTGTATRQNEGQRFAGAALGAVNAAGAFAQSAAAPTATSAQNIKQGVGTAGEVVHSFRGRTKAHFKSRAARGSGCPEWAPWLSNGNCYGTEEQACGGKTGCGAATE